MVSAAVTESRRRRLGAEHVVVGKVYVTLGLVWLAVVVEIALLAAVLVGGLRLLQALD